MSIQDMELQKQQYLEEMQSISNQIQIKDYRNERIDIHYRRECEIKIDELKAKFNKMSIEINKITKEKELRQREQVANLSTHTPEPSRRFNFTCYDDDEERTMPLSEIISQLPPSISSVEDLVPIPSESEDTSGSDSECDLPSCDDFSPINILEGKSVTFSNPLFDSNEDFTSSDNESLSDEDVPEDKPGYHDSEGDIIYLESLLINDTIPNLPPKVFLDHDPKSINNEPDNLKSMVKVFNPENLEKSFSPTYVRLPFEDRHYLSLTYVIRIFLPHLTYSMDSSLHLSSGSEDTIFDPDISAFYFSSLEPVASHRSGTFMRFNVYLNILNECPMEVCSSTYPFIEIPSGESKVTDISNVDKNEAKKDKTEHGIGRA
ncbi:hypothetical protein Tco_0515285 [Tanacetum coccineum]